METIQNLKQLSFTTQMALLSFAIGTILFGLYFAIPDSVHLIILGFFYIICAALINAIAFVNLFLEFISKPFEREELAIKMLIVLSNIPIAFLYILIIANSNKFSTF
jgi:hypothetical protein